ncbi:hypothetical protein SAMN05421869_110221 [Nonomuraea jiangxiensis]|uniref:DUF2269 family protein n=1 Tax=Nonomuraea jiangxiensis TaxID=633440 RepID=A0A1G8TLP3_9ACTN|nr:hypothetical protein SAMN05421869_110221 [Nonomuraea jiangxiensis]
MTRRGKQVLDILHVLTSVGWIGVGLCQLALNVIGLLTDDPHLRHAVHAIAHLLDRWLLIALALGSLTTGTLLGLKTRWGLISYWWVIAKIALSAGLLVFTPIWMGGWAIEATALSSDSDDAHQPAYLSVRDDLMSGSVAVVTTLVLIMVISVVKPWGRTPRGRRRQRSSPEPANRGRP